MHELDGPELTERATLRTRTASSVRTGYRPVLARAAAKARWVRVRLAATDVHALRSRGDTDVAAARGLSARRRRRLCHFRFQTPLNVASRAQHCLFSAIGMIVSARPTASQW